MPTTKLAELGFILTVLLLCHIPVYLRYRRNERDKIPPSVWIALLLTFLLSPTGGLLYVDGLIWAAIILVGLIATIMLPMILPKNLVSIVPLILMFLMCIPAARANQKRKNRLHVQKTREKKSQAQTPTTDMTADPARNLADLEKLAELKSKGIITEDEFNAKKKQILDL
jgi:hypothetical protein